MTDHDPIDTAWRIHGAITDWTGKVDAKASFALAIESAILAGVITLSADDHLLADLSGWKELWTYRLGVALLVAAVLAVMSVVLPRLRGRRTKSEWRSNFIYFGHLRHWPPDQLTDALQDEPLLPALSHQLVKMSEIAWRKHRALQVSLWLSVVGTALVGVAAALNA